MNIEAKLGTSHTSQVLYEVMSASFQGKSRRRVVQAGNALFTTALRPRITKKFRYKAWIDILYHTIAQAYAGSVAPTLPPQLQGELFLRLTKECGRSSDPRSKILRTLDPSTDAHPGPSGDHLHCSFLR
jgi:hypothetical protein